MVKANDIHPLKGKILVSDLDFGEKLTRGGLIITDDDGTDRGVHPRWAKVWRIGEDVDEDIKVNNWILLEHGRWSRGIEIEMNDETLKIHQADANCILAISDTPEDGIYFANEKIR